jgi:hypothetical protein
MSPKSRAATFILAGPISFLVLSLVLFLYIRLEILSGAQLENPGYLNCLQMLSMLFLPLMWMIGIGWVSGIIVVAVSWAASIGSIFIFHLLPYFHKHDRASVIAGILTYYGFSFWISTVLIQATGGLW